MEREESIVVGGESTPFFTPCLFLVLVLLCRED
jgi:hypothetical protein